MLSALLINGRTFSKIKHMFIQNVQKLNFAVFVNLWPLAVDNMWCRPVLVWTGHFYFECCDRKLGYH